MGEHEEQLGREAARQLLSVRIAHLRQPKQRIGRDDGTGEQDELCV